MRYAPDVNLLAVLGEALVWVFSIAGAMWLIVAAFKWLGARSPWRRK